MKYLLGRLIKEMNRDNLEMFVLVSIFIISLLGLTPAVSAGPSDDNHIHVDQVNMGDNFDLTIDQFGFGNMIRFSADHDNNTINLLQVGNNMYIGYTDAWGSGYNWGGDLDGLRN